MILMPGPPGIATCRERSWRGLPARRRPV